MARGEILTELQNFKKDGAPSITKGFRVTFKVCLTFSCHERKTPPFIVSITAFDLRVDGWRFTFVDYTTPLSSSNT